MPRRCPGPALFFLSGLVLGSFFLGGCVTMESGTSAPSQPSVPVKGTYHKVKKGETLYRIASAYHVTIDEIIQANKIPDVAHIEENQLILIPGAEQEKLIETATDEADPAQPAVEDRNPNEFTWPVQGKILYYFGQSKGSLSYLNKGIGIQAREGQPVHASRAGRVVFSDYLPGYSFMVILDHRDGYYSVYAQNAETTVKVGEDVVKGDAIARVGRTGKSPFLHFQILKKTRADNPLHYLP